MRNLARILMPFVLLCGSPNSLAAKTKVYLEVEHGKGYYQIDEQKTWLEFELRKNFFLRYKISLFADPKNRIYREEGKEFLVPKGKMDILTAIRTRAENPYQGNRIDTLDIFVNKKLRKVVIKDSSSHNPERIIEAWPAENEEFGKGIKKIEFYLLRDKNNQKSQLAIPLNIRIKHKNIKHLIYLYSRNINCAKNGN